MVRIAAIGIQNFNKLIERNGLYIDKTYFIKEWWENEDDVTLITRPRRFGKTLTMSMLEYFFQIGMQGRGRFLRSCQFGNMKNIGICREHIR